VRAAGHEYDEWSLAWERPSPRPLHEYGAVLVFGGAMHADQDDQHPWLVEENSFIQGLLERQVPMLGICLGIQLFAKAEGAAVYPLPDGPEIGWFPVELTASAVAVPGLRLALLHLRPPGTGGGARPQRALQPGLPSR
jgi:GMP synthase (glutamine-hydrolysing)